MSFSGLVDGIIPSQYYTALQNKVVDSVAIHTMAGDMSARACGIWFQTEQIQDPVTGKMRPLSASSNYGIGSDGQIYGYVDEKNYAWCTSCSGVDMRAIAIEVASTTTSEPFECTSEAYESLINLLVDICLRWNMTLRWKNDKQYALRASKGGPVTEQNMFVHRWFDNKSCPGTYLMERQGQIADEVNARLKKAGRPVPTIEYRQYDHTVQRSKIIFAGDKSLKYVQEAAGKNNPHVWMSSFDWNERDFKKIIEQVSEETAVCFYLSADNASKHKPEFYTEKINDFAIQVAEKNGATYVVSAAPVSDSGISVGTVAAVAAVGALAGGLGVAAVAATGTAGVLALTNTPTDLESFNNAIKKGIKSNVGYIDTYSAVTSSYSGGKQKADQVYNTIYQTIENVILNSYGVFLTSGLDLDVDYTKINPYLITIDRNTNSKEIDFDAMHENRIVGAILEYGALFDEYHVRYRNYKQPEFEKQKKLLDDHNLEYGYLATTRARTVSEARSEFQELLPILRLRPPRLGVWIKLDIKNAKTINDAIIEFYYQALVDVGFKAKIGLFITRDMLSYFSWDKFQERWLLWIDDHVADKSELEMLLTPEFFDVTLPKSLNTRTIRR